jgi:uncharacterized protein
MRGALRDISLESSQHSAPSIGSGHAPRREEEFLILRVCQPEDSAIALLEALFVRNEGAVAEQVRLAVTDGYRRLLSNAMETEIRLATKQRADGEAIRVFAENLRQLLLAAPLGQKRVFALDPGFRTGCKAVCLDAREAPHHEAIFPLLSVGAGDRAERDRILVKNTGRGVAGGTAPTAGRPRPSCGPGPARGVTMSW